MPELTPLFDSLSHPTLTGRWPGRTVDASFARLNTELAANGFVGACAVGLAGVERYEHQAFAVACAAYPSLVPVAGYGFHDGDVDQELAYLRRLGYVGIKIHPRYSGVELGDPRLSETVTAAARHQLVTFLCTYHHTGLPDYPRSDVFVDTVDILRSAPDSRVVLLHGGDVQLMRYAELVRHNDNLLLDVSFTMLKYAGSSLDADLRFLFGHLDQRVCVGVDHPEFSHAQMRARFEELAAGLPETKRRNVGSASLLRFLGIADS